MVFPLKMDHMENITPPLKEVIPYGKGQHQKIQIVVEEG
jgi:hypothetical protein